jgi:hypothetical protein
MTPRVPEGTLAFLKLASSWVSSQRTHPNYSLHLGKVEASKRLSVNDRDCDC